MSTADPGHSEDPFQHFPSPEEETSEAPDSGPEDQPPDEEGPDLRHRDPETYRD